MTATIIYAETGGGHRALSDWNGFVWEPGIDFQALNWATTHSVQVAIRNVRQSDGVLRDFEYEVLLFDADG